MIGLTLNKMNRSNNNIFTILWMNLLTNKRKWTILCPFITLSSGLRLVDFKIYLDTSPLSLTIPVSIEVLSSHTLIKSQVFVYIKNINNMIKNMDKNILKLIEIAFEMPL